MIECLRCGRLFPEVVGAPSQVCPHCGHESAEPKARAPAARAAMSVDPVGALTTAARVGAREYPRLLVLYLPALVAEIAIGFGLEAYSAAAGIPTSVDRMTDGQRMQFLGLGVPLMVLLFTLRLALWTFVAARTLDVVVGGARLRSWRALAGPSLLMGFVLTLTFAAGALIFLIGFFVFLHWFMYAPAQIAAGAPTLGAAFDRSRRFARDHRTYGFTALVVLLGLAVLVTYLLVDGLPGGIGIIAPALVAWLGGPIVPLLAASYVAITMRDGVKDRAPMPSAPAARTTTKCPRCSTLIAYTRGAGPVEVACPSCGYTGKVL